MAKATFAVCSRHLQIVERFDRAAIGSAQYLDRLRANADVMQRLRQSTAKPLDLFVTLIRYDAPGLDRHEKTTKYWI